MSLSDAMHATGVEVNYYFICKRKLWYFTHGITMEHNSTRVEIGKEVHKNSFKRKNKEIMIDNQICLDFIDKELIINETKLTKAMNDATRYQILYYIYYLENKGIKQVKGIVHYPKSKKREIIELDGEERQVLDKVLKFIYAIKKSNSPPSLEKKRKCKKCSYYELCFS
ncbi:MAG: CRISPR-associated protein Cas4 [Clostridia bacterium]|nr:CRISPR-associated protein Cas4 [Clostridia bacterium]